MNLLNTNTRSIALAAILATGMLIGTPGSVQAQSSLDIDGDNVLNTLDIDDDNDGVLDIAENFNQDPFGDADSDLILNWLDNTFTATISGRTFDKGMFDIDGDGILNQYDLDADGDGLYDGAEANGSSGIAIPEFNYQTGRVVSTTTTTTTSYVSGLNVLGQPYFGNLKGNPQDLAPSDGKEIQLNVTASGGKGYITLDLGTTLAGNQGYSINVLGTQKSGSFKLTQVGVLGATHPDGPYTLLDSIISNAGGWQIFTIPITADTRYLLLETSPNSNATNHKELVIDYITYTSTQAVTSTGLPIDAEGTTPGTSKYSVPDFDGDGIPNFLDKDSDNDGINDIIEVQASNNTLLPSGDDADGDGIDDTFDAQSAGKVITAPINFESTGNPDFTDIETDGDGLNDWMEAVDALFNWPTDDLITQANAYNISTGTTKYNTAADANSNNTPDFIDDADGDGTPNYLDHNTSYFYDTDNDGLIDLFDPDNGGATVDPVILFGETSPAFRNISTLTPLPVELVSFTAEQVMGSVILDWSTASELNNKGFEVLRSVDGQKWEVIGFVAGMGTTQDQQQYSFTDRHASSLGSKVVYYQLNQTDFNGENEKSEVRSVRMGNEVATEKPQVRFNMNEGRLHITPAAGAEYYMLTNVAGQQLRISPATTSYDMNGMTKGVYYFSVVYSNGTVETQPVVIK